VGSRKKIPIRKRTSSERRRLEEQKKMPHSDPFEKTPYFKEIVNGAEASDLSIYMGTSKSR